MINAYLQKWAIYGGFSTTVDLTTAAVTVNVKSPESSTDRLVFQRLKVEVLTGSAGKTWAFAAASGSPVLVPALDMSTSGVVHEFDFGPAGVVFADNDALRVTISAAGAAGRIIMEGYQK